jgi:predicted nucleotidyltransferase component of viral defense system
MSTGLNRLQRDLLEAFFAREQRFFLTGGAALVGFYLHHRQTLDLDLFTTEDHLEDGEAALFDAAQELGATVERMRTSTSFRRFLVGRGNESVVVDIVRDLAPQIDIEKPVRDGIRIDSPREIMANKLCTLLSRGELRDLVDVMALEKAGHRVEEHLELAARKDAGLTPGQLAWVLSQLEIGEDASPPGDVSPEDLREYLDDLVRRLSEAAYPG